MVIHNSIGPKTDVHVRALETELMENSIQFGFTASFVRPTDLMQISLPGRESLRRCHAHAPPARMHDCALHQTRGFGIFDEIADVGEPFGLSLRDDHRCEVGSKAVLQDARPW